MTALVLSPLVLVDRGREVLWLVAGVGVRGVEGRGRGLVTLEAGLVLAAVLVLGPRRREREADVSLDLEMENKVIYSGGIIQKFKLYLLFTCFGLCSFFMEHSCLVTGVQVVWGRLLQCFTLLQCCAL